MPARSKLWPDPRVKPPYGGAAVNWSHPLARGLAGMWLFNEGGGAVAHDLVGRNHVPLVGSPSWEAGAQGDALTLNGTSQYGQISSLPATLQVTNFSIVIQWRNNTSGSFMYLYDTNNDGGSGITIQTNSATNGFYLTIRTSGTSVVDQLTGLGISEGLNTFAVTYGGSGARTFANGNNQSSFSCTGSISYSGSAFTLGGRSTPQAGRYVQGALARVVMYSVGLSDDFIRWHEAEPYAMLRSNVRRHVFAAVAAAGHWELTAGVRNRRMMG